MKNNSLVRLTYKYLMNDKEHKNRKCAQELQQRQNTIKYSCTTVTAKKHTGQKHFNPGSFPVSVLENKFQCRQLKISAKITNCQRKELSVLTSLQQLIEVQLSLMPVYQKMMSVELKP
jgi:hypothetical protein